jgi:hypothetical protein
MASAAFDTCWVETAKLSFMTEVLAYAALEWATQSNIVFYVYFEEEESYYISCVTCVLFHCVGMVIICRGKNSELLSYRFLLYVVRLSSLTWTGG